MKKITFVLILLFGAVAIAQNGNTENTPEKFIKNFC